MPHSTLTDPVIDAFHVPLREDEPIPYAVTAAGLAALADTAPAPPECPLCGFPLVPDYDAGLRADYLMCSMAYDPDLLCTYEKRIN